LFERAASIGGYKCLTDFVVLTIQEKAKEIVREKEQIVSSERDSQIFFDAITNVNTPAETLNNALEDYNVFTSKGKK
jgi:uncharacterized protein (DUF1778 family)